LNVIYLDLDAIKSNKESGKIVGGSEVEPHSVPHQAALLVDDEFFCGGEITIGYNDSFQLEFTGIE